MSNNLIDNRHIRVFISSTFRDMQDERDYLMKRTFPKLRQLAAERDVTLTELDLRWGITEEESKSGKVVEICLREIENSIPFFIGIIGNRYGWIPQKEDLGDSLTQHFAGVNNYIERQLSVTEMEMQFGVLDREQQMHAYFYIKEQEEDSDNTEMLKLLKEKVRKSRYPSSSYKSLEDLATQIKEAFTSLLDKLFPNSHLTEIEKERIGQRSFMNQLCQNYIKQERNFKVLDSWLESHGKSHFVVTGASGLGKSALVANWVNEKLNNPHLKYNIIYHFTGNGGSESSHKHIIRTLINEIKELYGWMKDDSSSDLKDLFDRISSESDKPLLIVIDAINQIVKADNAKLLNWLPIPPKNIKILFSTLEDDTTMEVFKNRCYPVLTLRPLDNERRRNLVKIYLKLYGKSLNDEQLTHIVNNSLSENTRVLTTLLDELIKFGIYEKLDERIEYYLKSETIDDFYQIFLYSYEEEYGRDYIEKVLSVIAVSKHGLSEQEILAITDSTHLAWSQTYCSFISQFISKKGLISFSHIYFREAIEHRYLKEKETTDKYRKEIITVFKDEDSPRAWEELLHQYYQVGDISALSAILQNVGILNFMVKEHTEDVALYIRVMIDNGFDLLRYRELIKEGKDTNRNYNLFISFFVNYFSALELGLVLCRDYQQALEDSKINLPSEESWENLYSLKGRIYYEEAKYQDALKAFSNAYKVCKKKYGKDDPYTRGILHHILNEKSLIYQASGDFDKAISLGKQTLDLDLKIYGKNHQSTATAYNNMGVIYEKLGEYQKALEFELKALEIRQIIFGTNHPDTANSLSNVSWAYAQLGTPEHLKNALKYGEEALEIRLKIFGKDHPESAISYNNIGLIYGKLGDPMKELEYLARNLDITLKIYGVSHPTTINAYNNLAVTYEEIGDKQTALEAFQEALDYYHKALEIRIQILGEKHLETLETYECILNVYCLIGDFNKAIAYTEKIISIIKIADGDQSLHLAQYYEYMGIFYHAKKNMSML